MRGSGAASKPLRFFGVQAGMQRGHTHFALMALLCVGGLPALAVGAEPAASVRIAIESPAPGATFRDKVHQAPIRGSALSDGERPAEFDVMLVIDVSGSTQEASGVDVDGDGQLGFDPRWELVEPGTYPEGLRSTDPQDTILDAEVMAAEALVAALDPERVRVGVISFGGEMHPLTGERMSFSQQDAWLEVPLTDDHRRTRSAIRGILARGSHGGTNFAAGLRLAVRELAGLSRAKSVPRPGARKVVLFLTDGLPTFPIGAGSVPDPGDIEAALAAARLAHTAGITINSYALGRNALTNPIAATEIARITAGNFLPVENPGDIISFLQGVSFANIDDVVFTNLTTREVSTDVSLAPDGSFDGFVPVREGKNRVRVTALASNGAHGSVEFDLVFERSGLSGRELALELDRIRERNKQLQLLVERERIQRFRNQQRKVLEFGIEEEPTEN
ncbi:MAG: VWA domain-containing protein [Deltaproteobacteria bacterium]|nr:VWA domain-containing protein [Deltaproteobacteria bacterium]MBW2360268.1 VWA domain-containing protein [Deltaproteobacteria bacterium]